MKKDRDELEKELGELIREAKLNPPSEGSPKASPNVYVEKQYDADWRRVEEDHLVQYV